MYHYLFFFCFSFYLFYQILGHFFLCILYHYFYSLYRYSHFFGMFFSICSGSILDHHRIFSDCNCNCSFQFCSFCYILALVFYVRVSILSCLYLLFTRAALFVLFTGSIIILTRFFRRILAVLGSPDLLFTRRQLALTILQLLFIISSLFILFLDFLKEFVSFIQFLIFFR